VGELVSQKNPEHVGYGCRKRPKVGWTF